MTGTGPVHVCADCRDRRVGVLTVNVTKDLPCAVCHRMGKVFLVERMPRPAADVDPRTRSSPTLREMFTAFGFQKKGFLLWRPQVPPQAPKSPNLTPSHGSLYIVSGDGIGLEHGRLFLARGHSLETGKGHSFLDGMREILRFLEEG